VAVVIRNIAFLIQDSETVTTGCDLLVEGSRIAQIGAHLQVAPEAVQIDATGCAVIPGLINAHTHLYQNFLKGISPDVSLVPWCNRVLFPTVGAVREAFAGGTHRPAYLWTAAAGIEMIHAGVTCCLNMDVTSDAAIAAWHDLGFRGIMLYTLTNRWVPAELRSAEAELRRKALEFVHAWHSPQGLTQVFLAPSTPFLCNDELLQWVRDQAEALDLGIQIHVAEIAGEVADSLEAWGMTPVERLHRLGILAPRTSAVHCVHLNAHDIDLLAQDGVQVVHCPKSNMKLADGAAPIAGLTARGIPVSLGTDGCASNDLLDMWEEMRAALLLARLVTGEADAMTCQAVFRMATESAAQAARIDAGRIEPSKLADLAVVELKGAHLRPFHADHPVESLVLCGKASDVRDTIINGEVVMRDRCLTRLDEEQVLQEAEAVEGRLYARRPAFHLQAET